MMKNECTKEHTHTHTDNTPWDDGRIPILNSHRRGYETSMKDQFSFKNLIPWLK